MTLINFIKTKAYFFWYIKNPENLSKESILENVLNYGDFDDIKELLKILGMKNAARIFYKQLTNQRNNYRPKIANYFKLYFKKHA